MVVLNCLIMCNHCQKTNVSLCERKMKKKNDCLVKGALTTETKYIFIILYLILELFICQSNKSIIIVSLSTFFTTNAEL